jgi:branched-chain amino acid transport system substrate-binding protein
MNITRRSLLGTATVATAGAIPFHGGGGARAQGAARPVVRIGIMNDQSGTYRDITGPTGAACARQAIQDFSAGGFTVETLVGDHQNKADVAATLARRWIDVDGVDMVVGVGNSSCALAVNTICRDKNKVMLNTSAASGDLTGAQCTLNTIHWTYDTYMTAKSTGGTMVKAGGDSWYFITANYVFGQQLQRDTANFVTEAGGRVLGSAVYPFPETTDFSALLLRARSSGAKVIGLCNGGADTTNCIKQAREFGLTSSMRLAAMLMYATDIRSLGLEQAQGLMLSESFYWDLNPRTRAFTDRIRPKVQLIPNMMQAGDYAATLHYLKAVADLGPVEAKADGAATVARMKAMPTDDDCFGEGSIRADGRKIHPCYLFQAKAPSESRGPWDLLKLVATTPAEEAFRPMAQGGCALVRS